MNTFLDRITKKEQDKLETSFSKAVFNSAYPLRIVEDDNWKSFFNELRPAFKLPSRYDLSHRLLDEAYEETNNFLQKRLADTHNFSLMCDGWTNIRNEGIINFIITTPEPVFVKSVETTTEKHTSQYIKQLLVDILQTYNPQKFLCIITDNAANMRKATREIEEIYPHITSFGCFAHTLHLICSDLLKIKNISTIMSDVKEIIKLINRSHILVANFNILKTELKINNSLHLPVATRWGSNVVCLKSMEDCNTILKRIAIDSNVNIQNAINKKFTRLILEDKFWISINNLIKILEPITSWITRLETDKSNIHLVHKAFYEIEINLVSHLKYVMNEKDIKTCLAQFNERKSYSLKPIHYAAELLNPDPDHNSQLNEEERCLGMNYIDKLADFMGLSDDCIITELGKFLSRQGIFNEQFIIKAAKKVDVLTFWAGYCKELLNLSKVAVRLLSMPSTSAAVERSFSSQSIIHSKRRNRLTTERAIKLNYVRHNSKLLKVKTQEIFEIDGANESELVESDNEVIVEQDTLTTESSLDSESEQESWHSNITGNVGSDSEPECSEKDEVDEAFKSRVKEGNSDDIKEFDNIADEDTENIEDMGDDEDIIQKAVEIEERITNENKTIILSEITNLDRAKIVPVMINKTCKDSNSDSPEGASTASFKTYSQLKFIGGKWTIVPMSPIKENK